MTQHRCYFCLYITTKMLRALSLLVVVTCSVSSVYAALQTLPYLANRSMPLYAQAKHMPYANPTAPKGGEIRFAANGTFDNLNSMNGKGTAADGINFMFDTLMSNSLDEAGVMYPLLAQSVSYDPKQTQSVIFNLNPKARFSDGSPLTAVDVKFSFDTFQHQSSPALQMYLSDLAHTQVLSQYRVRAVFKSKHNPEMPLILASLPIYSQKDWQARDFQRVSLTPILASGPYVLDKIDAGRSIRYKRNAQYWGRDLAVNRGRYNFDRIQYVYYRSLDSAFEGFKSGQYTWHEEFTSRKWMTEYNFPARQAGLVKQLNYQHYNPVPTQSFVMNNRRGVLRDIRVRQALTYAYDFEWQNKALFYGQYQRLQSYFANSELAASGQPNAAELQILQPLLKQLPPLMRQGVLKDWQYPVSDGSGFNRQNLLRARQILLQAGYRVQSGQLLDHNGQAVVFEFLIHQEGLQRTLMPFVRNLKKLGIQVRLRQVDVPQYLERMRRFDFDLTTSVMPQSLNPGAEQAQFWSSAAANQPNNYNYAGIANPVIDQVLKGLVQAPTRASLITHTRVLDRLLRAGYYQIPTYGKGSKWYAYWNHFEHPTRLAKLDVATDYWWYNPKQAQKIEQYLKR